MDRTTSRCSRWRSGWRTAPPKWRAREPNGRRNRRRPRPCSPGWRRTNDRRPGTGTRAGFVALIGEPNAGKSTLLNRMVGAKVSIVTHKVQTTRTRIRGICMEGQSQIVFVDTPGLFKPRRRLDRAMVAAAWGGAADADIIVLMVEAHRGHDRRGGADHRQHARPHPAGADGGTGDQQDRQGAGRGAAGAGRKAERGVSVREDLHDLGREGLWREPI